MGDVIVKAIKNGPYEISGGAKLLDDSGKEYAESAIDPLYLCRCGASKTKPFATIATRTSASKRKKQRDRPSVRYSITPTGGKIGVLE